MQEALATALEFESYDSSSTGNFRVKCSSGFRAKRSKAHEAERGRDDCGLCERNEEAVDVCWHCGKPEHRLRDCYTLRREKKQNGKAESTIECGQVLNMW